MFKFKKNSDVFEKIIAVFTSTINAKNFPYSKFTAKTIGNNTLLSIEIDIPFSDEKKILPNLNKIEIALNNLKDIRTQVFYGKSKPFIYTKNNEKYIKYSYSFEKSQNTRKMQNGKNVFHNF